MFKWVARLSCGHDIGDETAEAPSIAYCPECHEYAGVMDIVTNHAERGKDGKR